MVREIRKQLYGVIVGSHRPPSRNRRSEEATGASGRSRPNPVLLYFQKDLRARRGISGKNRLVIVRAVPGGVNHRRETAKGKHAWRNIPVRCAPLKWGESCSAERD